MTGKMVEEYECFTVVFEGDIRKIHGNPHKLETPFGKVRSICVGDALNAPDGQSVELAPPPAPSTHVAGSDLLKRMSLALDDLSPEDTIGFTNGAFWIDIATVEEIRRAALATTEGLEG